MEFKDIKDVGSWINRFLMGLVIFFLVRLVDEIGEMKVSLHELAIREAVSSSQILDARANIANLRIRIAEIERSIQKDDG